MYCRNLRKDKESAWHTLSVQLGDGVAHRLAQHMLFEFTKESKHMLDLTKKLFTLAFLWPLTILAYLVFLPEFR